MSWFGMHDGFDDEMQNAPDIFARKPQTNYDCIISKTPKELAEFIWGVETGGRAYGCRGKVAWLKWLKQEATDES